jgi:hypothetical protein
MSQATVLRLMKLVLVVLATAFLISSPHGNAQDERKDKDLIRAGSAWKGEIRQGESAFPATFYFTERNKERIRGEIHFQTPEEWCQLTFQGNIIDGQQVAWITNRKAGNVTSPGLYIGKLDGKSIVGVWQVPSAGQYDSFSVKLSD